MKVPINYNRLKFIFFLSLNLKQVNAQNFPVSNNGQYACVYVDKSNKQDNPYTVIHSLGSNWKKEIRGKIECKFSGDSRKAYYQINDRLHVLTLGSDGLDIIESVKSFKVSGNQVSGKQWLAVHKNNGELVIFNESGTPLTLTETMSYSSTDDDGLIIIQNKIKSKDTITTLSWWKGGSLLSECWSGKGTIVNHGITSSQKLIFSVANGLNSKSQTQLFQTDGKQLQEVWYGAGSIISIQETDHGNGLVFMSGSGKAGAFHEIFHFRNEVQKARLIVSDSSSAIKGKFTIYPKRLVKTDNRLSGNKEPFKIAAFGKKVFLYLNKQLPDATPLATKLTKYLDVWSYFDPIFQTSQLMDDKNTQLYASIVDIETEKLTQIEEENEQIMGSIGGSLEMSDEYALLFQCKGDVIPRDVPNALSTLNGDPYRLSEFNWNSSLQMNIYLLSLKDGTRKLFANALRLHSAKLPQFNLSPDGKYIVYYDYNQKVFFSYEIHSGKRINLTKSINTFTEQPQNKSNVDLRSYYNPSQIVEFISKDNAILLKDVYLDIWKISLSGSEKPINLTQGFARKYNADVDVEFRLSDKETKLLLKIDFPISDPVNGFKNPGFYVLNADNNEFKKIIDIGADYLYSIKPIKWSNADQKNGFIFSKEKLNDPPKLVYLNTFDKEHELTSSQPDERKQNLVQRELLTWKNMDGRYNQGRLYKPVGFDSTQKYPVVVFFYELKGSMGPGRYFDEFYFENEFIHQFLRTGYLVFVPDVYHTEVGQTCYNTYNSVVSGATALSKKSYVNPKKMGLYGHSFGGYQVNCLITQTDMFAAAISGSGYSNMISSYLGDIPNSAHRRHGEGSAEVGQNRMGTTPWNGRDVYIANSPVFAADRVTTPLLLLSAKDDANVPYLQSVEMFKALRRCGKTVWFISGDTGDHGGPLGYQNGGDKTIQHPYHFFDYYLKDMPPRKWMTRGIPARLKGIVDGCDIDTEITTPPAPTLYEKEIVTPPQERLNQRIKTGKYPWKKH